MGRYSKLPHGFLHTFFSSGPLPPPRDTFVLCLNRALPGIPLERKFNRLLPLSSLPLRSPLEEESAEDRDVRNT